MIFTVQFTRDLDGRRKTEIIRTIEIEAEDLHSVVSRMRVILSTKGYEPEVDGFLIVLDGKKVYHERRENSHA